MIIRKANSDEVNVAMEIIDMAKSLLKASGIDQWQDRYPDFECISEDIKVGRGYFLEDENDILGYLCIDFDGEPAYDDLNGKWSSDEKYVVVHRLAFSDSARDKGISGLVFKMVEDISRKNGISYFRIDTDEGNKRMQHILKKNGFKYCGTIIFDGSEKIAFDKKF